MKVFGIGLNKTGTTTLRDCLLELGYRVKGLDRKLTRHAVARDLKPLFDVCEEYDGFQDFPWPLIYRQLDTYFPGSKFVLTRRRDSNTWFESQIKHAKYTGPSEGRKLAYGYEMPNRHRRHFIEQYERHNHEVREYFRDRSDDMVEICWEEGGGWPELCEFLGHPAPKTPLPHANQSNLNKRKIRERLMIAPKSWISLALDR